MNNKGFLLIDALVNTLIVSLLCLLCLITYKSIENYDKVYSEYLKNSNEKYDTLYNSLGDCVKCVEEQEEEAWEEP